MKKQITVKEVAFRMMDAESWEREEAERMMGCKFEDMTKEQRRIAATCLAGFWEYFTEKQIMQS